MAERVELGDYHRKRDPGATPEPDRFPAIPAAQRLLADAYLWGAGGVEQDVAAAVTYLASEEAGYVTGQTLHVNGGMAMI